MPEGQGEHCTEDAVLAALNMPTAHAAQESIGLEPSPERERRRPPMETLLPWKPPMPSARWQKCTFALSPSAPVEEALDAVKMSLPMLFFALLSFQVQSANCAVTVLPPLP